MAARRSPCALVVLLASSIALADDMVARSFCDAPPHDRLCSVVPKDNTDFDASFIYLNLEKNAQNPFDIFSWQTFVALNWPANDAGHPIDEPIGTHSNLPRVWQFWKQPADVFGSTGEDRSCRSDTAAVIATDMILQSTACRSSIGDLNYVVFDTRMNGSTERYIVASGLDSADGQRRFQQAGKVVDFPRGHYRDVPARTGGEPGAIAIKTSWKIIDAGNLRSIQSRWNVHGLPREGGDLGRTGRQLQLLSEQGQVIRVRRDAPAIAGARS